MPTSRSRARVAAAHVAYGALAHVAGLLALVPDLVRARVDPTRRAWLRQRLGRLPADPPGEAPVWIHAVSVGEVKAARPLVTELASRYPGLPVVLSTGTPTGLETARRLFPGRYVFVFPLDLPRVVRQVLTHLSPRLLVLLELEAWPTLLRLVDEAGVPAVILNGRVTERSYRRYRRLRWWLPEFDRLALVAAQDRIYGDRIARLGVPAERIVVTGNLKHDLLAAPDPALAARQLGGLGLEHGPPVFVAGSTHDGEDEAVIAAWRAAGGGRAAHLVLVPRHLERLDDIARLLRRAGLEHVRRSQCGAGRGPDCVLLVDTMGELELLFALADVVFLGGSLVPVGGHNVLEPAAAGRPVLVGPYLESCRREAELLAGAGGLLICSDAHALGRDVAALLGDTDRRRTMGERARKAVAGLAGAAAADVDLLERRGFLPAPGLEAGEESATVERRFSTRSPRPGAPSR